MALSKQGKRYEFFMNQLISITIGYVPHTITPAQVEISGFRPHPLSHRLFFDYHLCK
jgi:hypothetical protein